MDPDTSLIAMQNRPPFIPRPVSIAVAGRRYCGNYVVEAGMITVAALGQTETMPVGRLSAEDQARRMLAEIVRNRTSTSA
jgi:hypothetical protein